MWMLSSFGLHAYPICAGVYLNCCNIPLEITNNILQKKKITNILLRHPLCQQQLQKFKKRKNEKHLKHKKKTKTQILFNPLLQTTLNPCLQALFLQT